MEIASLRSSSYSGTVIEDANIIGDSCRNNGERFIILRTSAFGGGWFV